jgi:hypothetical protein
MTFILTRQPILTALRAALEPLDYCLALWEGGAAAFRRVDEWSDIDLILVVQPGRVPDAFAVIEQTLAGLSAIDLVYEVPQPTWHGMFQKFYRLKDTSPYLLLDVAITGQDNPNKFIETETHGQARVHFDKAEIVRPQPLDLPALQARLQSRLETIKVMFDLFQILTLKELNRGNSLEALSFYQAYTLRPLIEALRIRYSPTRAGFHTRYIHYDLPAETLQRLEELSFISNVQDLRSKREQAEAWFHEIVQG